jgi:hypothetical protein
VHNSHPPAPPRAMVAAGAEKALGGGKSVCDAVNILWWSLARATSRSRHSGTVISAPYRSSHLSWVWLDLMLTRLAPNDEPHAGRRCVAQHHLGGPGSDLIRRPRHSWPRSLSRYRMTKRARPAASGD